jgi:hypothetical protein
MVEILFLSKLFDPSLKKKKSATEPAISIMVYFLKIKGTLMDTHNKSQTWQTIKY